MGLSNAMPWPTPQDYNEAIQNPQTAFIDPELRAGKPELNALQLPRAITGQFASVYKMKCGARTWAVRCFLRNVSNQQQRYEAISAHLRMVKLPLPYVVDFEYHPQGIRVRGQMYPILKMAWVNGASLTSYIESHLASPGLLGNLAYRWLEMTRALRRAGVAHGDLQHGNVLVHNNGTSNALMLVDYDGMFVPALSGQPSYETGHRNFQHPQRNESHFDAEVDNFSAWVIYLSLYALRTEPKLWQKFAGGDECLLFRRRDFEQPEQSALLRALTESNDDHLRISAAAFKAMLVNRVAVGAIPNLDLQSRAGATSAPSWLADHVSVANANNGAVLPAAVSEAKETAVAATVASPQVAHRD
ncbi:MAG: hypothetical protein HC853_15515, partial [Anaerolineae bacterium]|nr:hypothetical protein [Anaerolineae bacterium]